MRRIFSVYCHTNKANGKTYVGITGQDPKHRWLNGHSYSKNKKFYADIQKFGWDGFEHRIVADGLNEKQAVAIEKEMITAYNSRELGYNNHDGGKYVPKRAVCHHGNEIKNAIIHLNYQNLKGCKYFLDVLSQCEEQGKRSKFTKDVNLFIEMIFLRFFVDGRPIQYSDPFFIADFLYEWNRVMMIHLWVTANGYTGDEDWDCDKVFPPYNNRGKVCDLLKNRKEVAS